MSGMAFGARNKEHKEFIDIAEEAISGFDIVDLFPSFKYNTPPCLSLISLSPPKRSKPIQIFAPSRSITDRPCHQHEKPFPHCPLRNGTSRARNSSKNHQEPAALSVHPLLSLKLRNICQIWIQRVKIRGISMFLVLNEEV